MSWRDKTPTRPRRSRNSGDGSRRSRRFRFSAGNNNTNTHTTHLNPKKKFRDVFRDVTRRREMSTAELSNALDTLNAMTFPRRDVTQSDCEKMIVVLIRIVPDDSEMLGSKLCSFINTLCVKMHIVLSHRGIDSVLKYLLKFGSRTSVFAADALKALSSLLIENGDRCSEHAETIAARLQRFADTSSVNLDAKHAAMLALANLCAKSGTALRECGKSKAMMDIFLRNFKVHAKVAATEEGGEEEGELIAKLISSILYGLEMVLSADPKLQHNLKSPNDMFNTLSLLVGYHIFSTSSSSCSRVRVHAVSLIRCLIRDKKSPFRQIVVQRLGTLIPSDEHEALSSKPVRTSVLTLITHDTSSTVRSEAALLAASLIQIIPRQLLVAYKNKNKVIRGGSSNLSLSDRISKSLYCTHSVLLGSLKRERVKSTLSAVLKAVEMLVQVTPWNVWNPKNLCRVMKALRTHIGSARSVKKRSGGGKGGDSSDQSCSESDADPKQRRERQEHTYKAAMKVMQMAIVATESKEVETYISESSSRYEPLVNEILSTHTSIDLERLSLGSALAKKFPVLLIRKHWTKLNSFLQTAFCSSNHKIRTEALKIAGSLFRGVGSTTLEKDWTNLVMQIGGAVQDPSSAVCVCDTQPRIFFTIFCFFFYKSNLFSLSLSLSLSPSHTHIY